MVFLVAAGVYLHSRSSRERANKIREGNWEDWGDLKRKEEEEEEKGERGKEEGELDGYIYPLNQNYLARLNITPKQVNIT